MPTEPLPHQELLRRDKTLREREDRLGIEPHKEPLTTRVDFRLQRQHRRIHPWLQALQALRERRRRRVLGSQEKEASAGRVKGNEYGESQHLQAPNTVLIQGRLELELRLHLRQRLQQSVGVVAASAMELYQEQEVRQRCIAPCRA